MHVAFTVALVHIAEIGCSVNLSINIVILALNYYEKVVDQYAHVGSIRIAYRKFSAETGIPLTLWYSQRCRGTMDYWDHTFINPRSFVIYVISSIICGGCSF